MSGLADLASPRCAAARRRTRWLRVACVVAAVLARGIAEADPPQGRADAAAERSARLERPRAVYLELLGKGGLYGVGYDHALADRLALGGAVSFLVVDDERVLTLAPYVGTYPWAGRRSALLVQVGAQIVRVTIPSHVRGFSGASSTGLGGQFSIGYELRAPVLFRAVATGVGGRGGFRPWVGIAMGGSFR
jgi:hypothetical protein